MRTNNHLLVVDELKTYFPIRKGLLRLVRRRRASVGHVRAVDGVSFEIDKGQTLGLVGESGSGKTTVARSIVRLVPVTAGRVIFHPPQGSGGRVEQADILSANRTRLRRLRRQIGLIFQDPAGSLNPRMTAGNIIAEPLRTHRAATGSELSGRIAELLVRVGLSIDQVNRYPHEFSGGQRQRICIARALALEPKLVICDEPVSALDVSIQAQILNLLKDLQHELGLTYLFIAHDLAVVEFFCDVVAVMYRGKIVEQATAQQLYRNPLHPYTRTLMAAIPQIAKSSRHRGTKLLKEPAGAPETSAGCLFHARCPLRSGDCLTKAPPLSQVSSDKQHWVACWKCQ
jgi:oligopeptide/dipeptide ABC transporter ATP-binding protein